MMKLILTIMVTYLFMKIMKKYITMMSNSMLLIMLILSNSMFLITNESLSSDNLSLLMTILTIISIILIILSSSNLNNITNTITPILIILVWTFLSTNMLNFYILFEIVLIPTMILITMTGKQPERLQAGIYLIIYTILASLPLLVSIISLKNNPSFIISATLLMKYNLITFMLLAFLVKMPMYFTHLWLPKAHVEAPLEGSMILAAVLLKLGGYGLIRFLPICQKYINKMNNWIISISLIGATATSMNCIRQKDLKSLIAYSSVAHMGFVLASLFSMNHIGLNGALTMMIAHGLSSSALFLMVNDLYTKYHSRNIILFKGIITMMPNITFWWFMFMATNISAPPTMNTLSEILMMSSIINWSNTTFIMLFMLSIMTASFSMLMFININHNKNELLPTSQTNYKLFMSMFIHLSPMILILLKLDMIIL